MFVLLEDGRKFLGFAVVRGVAGGYFNVGEFDVCGQDVFLGNSNFICTKQLHHVDVGVAEV